MKMFVEPPAIYLYKQPVDFRKSINGLDIDKCVDEGLSPAVQNAQASRCDVVSDRGGESDGTCRTGHGDVRSSSTPRSEASSG